MALLYTCCTVMYMFCIIHIPALSVPPHPCHYPHNQEYTLCIFINFLLLFLFLITAVMTPCFNNCFIVTENCICFNTITCYWNWKKIKILTISR
jgi:hypothetical protein